MKKVLPLLLLFCFGCATAAVPFYLPNKKPYLKRFYADYEMTLAAVHLTLGDLGWKVEKTVDPAVYEQMRTSDLDEKQILLITGIRQGAFVVGSRHARMNIYLRSRGGISEVEIRYLTMSALTFKNIKDYSNDSEVKRIWGRLEEILSKEK